MDEVMSLAISAINLKSDEKITGEEADKVIKLRKKKYGMFARLTGIFTSQKGNLVVYSIELIN